MAFAPFLVARELGPLPLHPADQLFTSGPMSLRRAATRCSGDKPLIERSDLIRTAMAFRYRNTDRRWPIEAKCSPPMASACVFLVGMDAPPHRVGMSQVLRLLYL